MAGPGAGTVNLINLISARGGAKTRDHKFNKCWFGLALVGPFRLSLAIVGSLSLALSGSPLWLSLALSGSLWLSLARVGSLSGSLSLSRSLSRSLWLTPRPRLIKFMVPGVGPNPGTINLIISGLRWLSLSAPPWFPKPGGPAGFIKLIKFI